jgi:hypothetical protein
VTRRIATIQRRTSADEAIPLYVEIAAAGMLWSWSGFRTGEWATRRFWAAIASAHGERIDAKVREAMPGCRPGYRFALGEFPPLPLVKPLPPDHIGQREHLDVDGVRHWHVGEPWQRCQAEHLREVGEVDGKEWRRFTRWRDAGLPLRYVTDESPDQTPTIVAHCCCS